MGRFYTNHIFFFYNLPYTIEYKLMNNHYVLLVFCFLPNTQIQQETYFKVLRITIANNIYYICG